MNRLLPIVILAGGLATRLRPITETIPKALILLNGEPFINHQLRLLLRHGIRDVVLCVGYLSDQIVAHVKDGRRFGLRVQYAYDGPALLGTGGAIKNALPYLPESFFVLNGDSYLPCDYASIQLAFQKQQKQGLMTVYHNQGKWDTSNVEYKNGKIIAYHKINRTPDMQYIDYGVSILTQSACQRIPDGTYDLSLLHQDLLKNDQLGAFEIHERFYEVGSLAGIKDLDYYLAHQMRECVTVE